MARTFSAEDEDRLRQLHADGVSRNEIARQMEWSVGTITNHAQRLGLSFGEDKPLKQDDHSVDALRYTIKTTQHIWRPHVALNFEEVA